LTGHSDALESFVISPQSKSRPANFLTPLQIDFVIIRRC
jgi:hypothetical protein